MSPFMSSHMVVRNIARKAVKTIMFIWVKPGRRLRGQKSVFSP